MYKNPNIWERYWIFLTQIMSTFPRDFFSWNLTLDYQSKNMGNWFLLKIKSIYVNHLVETTLINLLCTGFSKADRYLLISKFSLMIGKFLFYNDKILSLNGEGKNFNEFLTALLVPFSFIATTIQKRWPFLVMFCISKKHQIFGKRDYFYYVKDFWITAECKDWSREKFLIDNVPSGELIHLRITFQKPQGRGGVWRRKNAFETLST